MRRFRSIPLLVACGAPLSVVAQTPDQVDPNPAVVTVDVQTLRAEIREILDRHRIPGASIALVDRNRTIWAGGVGRAGPRGRGRRDRRPPVPDRIHLEEPHGPCGASGGRERAFGPRDSGPRTRTGDRVHQPRGKRRIPSPSRCSWSTRPASTIFTFPSGPWSIPTSVWRRVWPSTRVRASVAGGPAPTCPTATPARPSPPTSSRRSPERASRNTHASRCFARSAWRPRPSTCRRPRASWRRATNRTGSARRPTNTSS